MRVLGTCWTDFKNQKCFGIVHSWAVIIAIRHLYLTHNPGTWDRMDFQAVRWKPAVLQP